MEEQEKQVDHISKFCKLLSIGLMYRLSQILSLAGDNRLEIICLRALAEAEQGMGRFVQAADHFRQLLRKLPPLVTNGEDQRGYAITLALAGNADQAITYTEKCLLDAKKIADCVRSEQSMLLLAQSSHTAGLIFELVGDTERANEVRQELYEKVRTLPIHSKAHHIGLLCAGEALAKEEQHERAIPLLKQFVEIAPECYQRWSPVIGPC